MQEHGVSKIVSVKFHKADEEVTDHPPKPLVSVPAIHSIEAEEDEPHEREETLEIVTAK